MDVATLHVTHPCNSNRKLLLLLLLYGCVTCRPSHLLVVSRLKSQNFADLLNCATSCTGWQEYSTTSPLPLWLAPAVSSHVQLHSLRVLSASSSALLKIGSTQLSFPFHPSLVLEKHVSLHEWWGWVSRNTDDHHSPAHSLSTLGRTSYGT